MSDIFFIYTTLLLSLIFRKSEGLLHSQLHHSSILKLFSYFGDDKADYFVMELCENGDLRHFLKQFPSPFDEDQVCAYCRIVRIFAHTFPRCVTSLGNWQRDCTISTAATLFTVTSSLPIYSSIPTWIWYYYSPSSFVIFLTLL